ncbi:MAG: hypothetical protein AAGA77_03260 [Bacteroidota bacterium]
MNPQFKLFGRVPCISISFLILVFFLACISTGCKDEDGGGYTADDMAATITCEKDGATLQLDCPALPNTNVKYTDGDTTTGVDFNIFAWNTFAALNWPALVDSNVLQRGIPDLGKNKSFMNASHDDVLVWETFKEKREVFNVSQTSTTLPSWNSAPNYGTLRGGKYPSYVPGTIPGSSTPPSGLIWNALDESIQVKSEGLENDPYNGLVVSPRVWRGAPDKGNPVLYEVKVNYDFYDYVNQNQLFIQDKAELLSRDSINGPITLPYRTSAGHEKSTTGKNKAGKDAKMAAGITTLASSIKGYDSANALTSYQNANNNPSTSNIPYSIGSIHLKAAWIQLTDSDKEEDYHTTTAEYYVTDTTTNELKKQYATFGLIGLHIIQRIHTTDSIGGSQDSIGGTFIFATWEHTSVESGYTYSNYKAYDTAPVSAQTVGGWYPHKAKPDTIIGTGGFGGPQVKVSLNPDTYPVQRKFPILSTTASVNKKVWNSLPSGSVWKNYQLIGVQFKSIDINSLPGGAANPNDPTSIGQPLYLANLVIETNEGLQHFQGQPPATYPIARYSTPDSLPYHSPTMPPLVANGNFTFMRDNRNMVFHNKAINMGGCMGCHGVAQSEGYSFSFVLLGGYDGASTDSQMEFDLPPPVVYNPVAGGTKYPPYEE